MGDTIMDEIKHRVRDQEKMEEINTCRTWLKVRYVSDLTTLDGMSIHPGYMEWKRFHESKWSWPRWVPPKSSWKIWQSAMASYMSPLLPIQKRPIGHQIVKSWMNKGKDEVEINGKVYEVSKEGGRKQILQPSTGNTVKSIPCDIYEGKSGTFLLSGMLETIHEIETEEEGGSFLDALIEAEPSFEYIFRELGGPQCNSRLNDPGVTSCGQ